MRRLSCFLLGYFFLTYLAAQGNLLPEDNPAYHFVDRWQIKSGIVPPFHPNLRGYTRGDVMRFALTVDTQATNLSRIDRWDLQYVFRDNNEWLGAAETNLPLGRRRRDTCDCFPAYLTELAKADPRWEESERPVLKHFYRTPANFFEANEPAFYLRVNPILNLQYAVADESDERFSFNQRGVDVRGGVDDRIFFSFNILETQAQLPNYVDRYIDTFRTVPRAGIFKRYSGGVFNVTDGYDFLTSQGQLGMNISPHVGIQAGFGRHFIGNGRRSLILSDFSNNALYLRLNWKVWKLQLQNTFVELARESARSFNMGTEPLPKKYLASHHLSINVGKSLNVGIFENVVFSRENGFEFQYLNPIILYRAIEQGLGSPDNVMIGLDGRWNLLQRFQLYGQLVFDEFVFDELFAEGRGWWGNKYGIQAGAKYIDVLGVDHLDLQVEYNRVRPYTYAHFDSSAHFSHYNQALAHPLGANFQEFYVRLRYRPTPRLFLDAQFFRMEQGEDSDENFGANILRSYLTRVSQFGNELLQGIRSNTNLTLLNASYMFRHNLWLDAGLTLREEDSTDDSRDLSTQFVTLGIRWNVGRAEYGF